MLASFGWLDANQWQSRIPVCAAIHCFPRRGERMVDIAGHSTSAICMTDDRALVHWRWTRCIVITHWPDTIKLSVMIVARPGARTTNARVAFIKLRQIIGTLRGSIIEAARSTAEGSFSFSSRLPRETEARGGS